MSEDTSVMFEIGVMENPATKAKIDSFTKLVVDAQAFICQGYERVGAAVTIAAQAQVPLTAQIKAYRDSAVTSLDDIRGAIVRLQSIAEDRVEQVIQVVVKGADAAEMLGKTKPVDIDVRMPDDLQQMFNKVGAQIDGLRQNAADPIALKLNVPSNLKNVFKELGDVSVEEANRIGAAFDESIAKLPQSVAANTAKIKQEYAKRVASQAEAYGKMATDLDAAIEEQGQATERINSNMVKAAKSVVGAAQGFAQLGMLSAESTESLMKGLVAIEGVVNILDGGVDLLEAFSGGWKSVRQSTEAANKVAEIQKAMMGPQFAGMKAYQAQLIQETVAANATTAANTRLNASRGAKGGVAGVASQAVQSVGGAVANQAVGAGASRVAASVVGSAAVGGGAAAAAGGGFLSTSIAGVATGVLGSIAAAGAALAAVSLVAVELSETFRGTAGEVGSITDTIASGEASFAAGALRMTGLFESLDSPATKLAQSFTGTIDSFIESIPGLGRFKDQLNFASGAIGDFAGLAASTATVARAAKSLQKNKILNEHKEAIDNVNREGANEKSQTAFKEEVRASRTRADNVGSVDSVIANEMKVMADAARGLAESQRSVDKAKDGGEVDAKAEGNVKFFTDMMMQSQSRQNSALNGSASSRLDKEQGIGLQIEEKITEQIELQNALKAKGLEHEKEGKSVQAMLQDFNAMKEASIERQKGLVKEKLSMEIQGQGKVVDLLKSQLDIKTQALQKSQDAQSSAMTNFAKLGQIEKQQAMDALQQARTKGSASLSDPQKDLLNSIGTEESKRFAREGDEAEAKKFGFSDKNFGKGFAQEQAGLIKEKLDISAKMSSSYDVNVKVQDNTNEIVDLIAGKVDGIMADRVRAINDGVDKRMNSMKTDINNTTTNYLRNLHKSGGR